MQALRSLALGLARAAIWPLYLVLAGLRGSGRSLAAQPGHLGFGRVDRCGDRDFRPRPVALADIGRQGGRSITWACPRAVARQLNSGGRFVVVAAVVFILPVYLFDHELIAPEGKPITAPSLGRLLVLGYELLVWGTCVRLLRGWLAAVGLDFASAVVGTGHETRSRRASSGGEPARQPTQPGRLHHRPFHRVMGLFGVGLARPSAPPGRGLGSGRHRRHHRARRAGI